MIASANHRIAALLDVPIARTQAAPATRSPAQRQTARANGSRSRGPTSREGKARSRFNAMKHGLLARHLMPPADVRGHDRLYVRLRRELADQFKPMTFTDWATLDALAADYVQLVRARGLLEALHRPPRPDPRDAEQWHQHEECRRDLRMLEKLLADNSVGFRCPAKAALRLAQRVAAFVADLKYQVTSDEFENDPAKISDDFERQELLQLQARWAAIRPGHKRLADSGHVADVLRGAVRASTQELRRLRTVLDHLAEGLRRSVGGGRDLVARLQRQQAEAEEPLAASPERLLLLQRYITRIERQIETKIRLLQDR